MPGFRRAGSKGKETKKFEVMFWKTLRDLDVVVVLGASLKKISDPKKSEG